MTPYATIFYLPPPGWGCVNTFVENLNLHKPAGRTIVFSDWSQWPAKLAFPNEFELLTASPETLEQRRQNPTTGISNWLFGHSMRICRQRGVQHALYLEIDCRVGPSFDHVVFEEYNKLPFPVICAGSLASFNAVNGGLAYLTRLADLICRARECPTPIMTMGTFPFGDKPCNPSLFCNGAGAVYSVDWMFEIFGEFQNMMAFGTGQDMEGKAFDYQIGQKLRERFGLQVFDALHHLKSVCSTYGDHSISMVERLDLLRSGKVVIAHQFKGKETI